MAILTLVEIDLVTKLWVFFDFLQELLVVVLSLFDLVLLDDVHLFLWQLPQLPESLGGSAATVLVDLLHQDDVG